MTVFERGMRMSKKIEPEEMLKRVFRVAEILASSESTYQLMQTPNKQPEPHREKREKSLLKNTNV